MKRYLRRLAIISILFLGLLISFGSIRMLFIRHHSWSLPDNVHIVFLGASHFNKGIDDSLMKDAVNWSRASERYMYTYIKLQHLIPNNPQIDTVFLEFAPTDVWEDADYKYYDLNEQTGYVKSYWPFYNKDNWSVVLREPVQVVSLIIKSLFDTEDLRQGSWWKHLGGYEVVTDYMDPASVKENLELSRGYGNKVNYDYLRRIVDLCKSNNIKLIFLETPTYHPEYFFDQNYYYNAYRCFFSDVEFVDYSNWPAEYNERFDAHHLNDKGAKRFTKEIMNRFHIN